MWQFSCQSLAPNESVMLHTPWEVVYIRVLLTLDNYYYVAMIIYWSALPAVSVTSWSKLTVLLFCSRFSFNSPILSTLHLSFLSPPPPLPTPSKHYSLVILPHSQNLIHLCPLLLQLLREDPYLPMDLPAVLTPQLTLPLLHLWLQEIGKPPPCTSPMKRRDC